MMTSGQLAGILHVITQVTPSPSWRVEARGADGSVRRFFRLHPERELAMGLGLAGASCIAILPAVDGARELAEARACFLIGSHLHARHVQVPAPLGYDPGSGLVVFADLGDTLLHGMVREQGTAGAMGWYREAVQLLARFQVQGRAGFEVGWCCDTQHYDRSLMLERESGYFLERFWQGYLGMNLPASGLRTEFEVLADRVAEEPSDYLLHRDFQSRNLMVHQGRLWVIDFQGARLGPLAYDLAALLLDPYVSLTSDQQGELMDGYLDEIGRYISLDRARFVAGYYYMALQRNLQILGAFGYLTTVRNKPFFRDYIPPALHTLHDLLSQPDGRRFPRLRSIAAGACEALCRKESQEKDPTP